MKKIVSIALLGCALLFAVSSQAQKDKSKRASLPATVSQKIKSGATVTIDYSQPLLKGRSIGKDVEPMDGQVWRMGANEATVFQVDKEVTIEGKQLPAGKYSLFGISNGKDYTLIFNKAWDVWGTTYDQHTGEDALRVDVKKHEAKESLEKLAYTIDKDGKVALQWGTMVVDFKVK
jgi:hypothetical protein